MKLAYLVLAFCIPAHAYQVGEITSVREGNITFYRGSEPVSVDERVDVLNSLSHVQYSARVVSVDAETATAEVVSQQLDYGFLEKLQPGMLVRLTWNNGMIASAEFDAGLNQASQVGDFGGTGYSLGLQYLLPLKPNLYAAFQIHVDDLGKDSSGVGKRKSYFMVGAGSGWAGFRAMAAIGIVDIMTIPKEGSTSQNFDPYSGATYPSGVVHKDLFGYLISVQYPITLKALSRSNALGWALVPTLRFGQQLGESSYGPIASLSLGIDGIFF